LWASINHIYPHYHNISPRAYTRDEDEGHLFCIINSIFELPVQVCAGMNAWRCTLDGRSHTSVTLPNSLQLNSSRGHWLFSQTGEWGGWWDWG
jgi:hypothetical protein